MKKQFSQKQKLVIVEKGEETGTKRAAEVAEVHYTTVFPWKKQLKALGEKAFLPYELSRPDARQERTNNRGFNPRPRTGGDSQSAILRCYWQRCGFIANHNIKYT